MEAHKFKFRKRSPRGNALEYHLYKLENGDWMINNNRTGEIVIVFNAKVREWLNKNLVG